VTLLTFMVPVGIAVSTGILVGNNIGANNVKAARYYSKINFTIAGIWSICMVILLNSLKPTIAEFFAKNLLVR